MKKNMFVFIILLLFVTLNSFPVNASNLTLPDLPGEFEDYIIFNAKFSRGNDVIIAITFNNLGGMFVGTYEEYRNMFGSVSGFNDHLNDILYFHANSGLMDYNQYRLENGQWILERSSLVSHYRFGNLNVDSIKNTDIIYSSKDIIDLSDGSIFYNRSGLFWADVNIVLPPDGFIDNIEVFNVSVITKFTRFITDEEINDIRIDVRLNDGSVQGEVTSNKMTRTSSYSINELAFYVEVPPGENRIDVIYYYKDIEIGRDSVTFTRLLGFVDEDGDGLDDRTGQPHYIRHNIEYDTDNIGQNVYDAVKNAYNGFSGVFAFLGNVFSMFPAQIVAISTAFIGLLIVLRILGR